MKNITSHEMPDKARAAPQSANAADSDESEQFTPRQGEVLSAVLEIMIDEGDSFSLAKVAKRASCSKETLYNWFGDRDGLLTATVKWQAAKVAMPEFEEGGLTAQQFRANLTNFAISWLEVISSDVSAALNRMAIADAGSKKSRLGQIVLENGPLAMKLRLQKMFEHAQKKQLLRLSAPCQKGDMESALRSFFGLVVADWQIRKLLGETTRPKKSGIEQTARHAVDQFLQLYGLQEKTDKTTTQTGE